MSYLYEEYLTMQCDESGAPVKVDIRVPEDFNFGFDVVDELAERVPDKTAMLWVSEDGAERRFTFADMRAWSNRAANVFRSAGIRKGDRVMLVLKRHYQFWFAIVALHKLGAVAIPATHLLMDEDFVYRFNSAGVKAIVCTAEGDVHAHAERALPECPTLETQWIAMGTCPGWRSFDEELAEASPVFERPEGLRASDPMLLYFSSGTAGLPKMVLHDNAYPLGHIITAVWWHNVDPDGLHFTVADTGWGKAVWGKLYGQWMAEAGVFTYDFEKFVPGDVLSMIRKYKITTFCAPPTIYRFFIKEDLHKYDLSCLQYATTAGEALNPEVYNQFLEATGLAIKEGFGQTETTLTVANLRGIHEKPGSMGLPSPAYDIVLIDDDGKPARPGVVGEICLRTGDHKPAGLFLGYYNDPERTASVWHDGLYHTGDMAWRDEDGYLWYVGRTDDLIKSSGYRIGPFEIESVLMEHPAVLECAITGVPDEVRGQIVKATIVLARGYAPSEELKKEIQTYVKTHTAPYKYPRRVEFVEELPKTISGKIRRVALREKDKAQK